MTSTPNWVRGLCIGRGSFGTVSLAVDKTDGAVFAVKSVNKNSGRFSQALENEIRILKSLSSPYVVGYRGDDVTSENSSVLYRNLHMEYMPGGTVADLAKHGEDVTVRSYTRCIVSALRYIHERNIVHCDVKGKNVLIGVIPGEAKLADFGSAVELGVPVSGSRGSPLWMAPEVLRGECQGPESDVWSLGCTVIEMVTGKPAWQDRGVDTLCQIGYSDEIPNLPGHFSDELRDFLSKCLRREPSERWSCDQLLRHPFLLSCSSSSSEFTDKKWSPRCVFDWSDSNFSEGETSEIENTTTNLNSSNAIRRIGTLASNSAANWESDGWELVRNAAVTTNESSSEEEEEEDMSITEAETSENWPEYSDSATNNDEEAKREYGDSNGGFQFHNDHKCSKSYAQRTRRGCSSEDSDNNYSCYSCCMYVSLKKLLLFNSNAIRHIYYKQLFMFIFKQISDLFSVSYSLINYSATNILLKKEYPELLVKIAIVADRKEDMAYADCGYTCGNDKRLICILE
ncbi:hypothetical protein L1887_05510 [Cichorium endivia]|nr:hypothetical protein L1887_05510 [Cichorium endivia]